MTDIMKGISPLPWKIHEMYDWSDEPYTNVIDSKGEYIAEYASADMHNAAYIVHACNLYPELVEALEVAVREFDVYWPMRTADVHKHDCECLRCSIDAIRAILAKCKAGA